MEEIKIRETIADLLISRGIHTIEQVEELLEPSFYAVIPINILEKKTISANSKLLYAEILALSKKSGKCFATNEYLAERLGLSKRTIPSLLKELKDDLLINVSISRDKKGTYRDIIVSLVGEVGSRRLAYRGIAKGRGQKRNRQREIDKENKNIKYSLNKPIKGTNWSTVGILNVSNSYTHKSLVGKTSEEIARIVQN